MKKRVIIIHGYTGYPNKNWFPWLKKELEERGFEVSVPAMPNTEAPKLSEWLPFLQKLVGEADENTYFIGHSLGCITILRYLESLPDKIQVGGVVLVAGFSRPIHFKELNNFFETPLNYKKCRDASKFILLINSDNDPHVPLGDREIMEKELNASLIVYKNGGHLNEKIGFKELPIVLNEFLKYQEKK